MLTRLGNLLVREHCPEEAIRTFQQALDVDNSMYNVWFNMAHAQIALKDMVGARESLGKALELKNDLLAATHMIKALSDEEAGSIMYADSAYVRELYDNYASNYDEHGKKLRYAAPRVIREEMAKIYKAIGRFEGDERLGFLEDEGGETCAPSTMGTSEGISAS